MNQVRFTKRDRERWLSDPVRITPRRLIVRGVALWASIFVMISVMLDGCRERAYAQDDQTPTPVEIASIEQPMPISLYLVAGRHFADCNRIDLSVQIPKHGHTAMCTFTGAPDRVECIVQLLAQQAVTPASVAAKLKKVKVAK